MPQQRVPPAVTAHRQHRGCRIVGPAHPVEGLVSAACIQQLATQPATALAISSCAPGAPIFSRGRKRIALHGLIDDRLRDQPGRHRPRAIRRHAAAATPCPGSARSCHYPQLSGWQARDHRHTIRRSSAATRIDPHRAAASGPTGPDPSLRGSPPLRSGKRWQPGCDDDLMVSLLVSRRVVDDKPANRRHFSR